MSTSNHRTGTRLATLTEAWRTLLRDCVLPAPALVSLEPTINRITIQPGRGRGPLDHLGELLLWAYTLEQVTAGWWHTPSGDLHLSIEGRTTTGVPVKAYGGIPVAHCAGLVQLAPDDSESVSVDEISTLLGLLRDHHQAPTAGVIA